MKRRIILLVLLFIALLAMTTCAGVDDVEYVMGSGEMPLVKHGETFGGSLEGGGGFLAWEIRGSFGLYGTFTYNNQGRFQVASLPVSNIRFLVDDARSQPAVRFQWYIDPLESPGPRDVRRMSPQKLLGQFLQYAEISGPRGIIEAMLPPGGGWQG